MDILAHGLWAAALVQLVRRRTPVTPGAGRATVAAAVVPDLMHALPLLLWTALAGGRHGLAALSAYAVASPGQEPALPAWVALASHHLHCIAHSALIAALVTVLCWVAVRRVALALVGWWSHVVIDVFTHSADYYPVPVFYPLSNLAFDGIAWNEPWALAANYAALAAVWSWLLLRSRHRMAVN